MTVHQFDVVLKNGAENEELDGCRTGGEEERCHVEVYDVPWQKIREVHKITCNKLE